MISGIVREIELSIYIDSVGSFEFLLVGFGMTQCDNEFHYLEICVNRFLEAIVMVAYFRRQTLKSDLIHLKAFVGTLCHLVDCAT